MEGDNTKKKSWVIRLGVIMMLSSGVFFAGGLLIPLLELSAKTRIIAATGFFIAMEVVFWTGGLLDGKELFIKYKSYISPKNWLKKSPS